MSAFDEVIRAAGEQAAMLDRIAKSQRSLDAVCRGGIARLMAADRSAVSAGRLLGGPGWALAAGKPVRWGQGVAGGGDAG
jgi:hypothetical protein